MDLKGGGGSSRNLEAMKDTPPPPHPWPATTLHPKVCMKFYRRQRGISKCVNCFYWMSDSDDVCLLTLRYFSRSLHSNVTCSPTWKEEEQGMTGCGEGDGDRRRTLQRPTPPRDDDPAPGRESLSTLQHNYLVFTFD